MDSERSTGLFCTVPEEANDFIKGSSSKFVALGALWNSPGSETPAHELVMMVAAVLRGRRELPMQEDRLNYLRQAVFFISGNKSMRHCFHTGRFLLSF